MNDASLIEHFKNIETSDLELAIDIDYMMVPTNDTGFERLSIPWPILYLI